MVTIEQKLTLFSKLLQQDIKEDVDRKLMALDEKYEKKITFSKEQVDKEAELIVQNAIKRAEAKKVEIISKGKMSNKRECMLAKEKYIAAFIDHLKEKIKEFTELEAYKSYLDHYLVQFEDLKGYENKLVVYLTARDFDRYKKYIKEKLGSLGLDKDKLSFEIADDSILGGIIIEDPKLNMRIDTSIATLLEESRGHIIETILGAIEEAGETLG